MAADYHCRHCAQVIPESAVRCPHCGLPGDFPNVRAAERGEDKAAVDKRLRSARRKADGAGTRSLLDELETRAGAAKAVICKHASEVQRIASSAKQGIASYYQTLEAELRLPDGDEWDILRRHADLALFPGYQEDIRFAALSLDHTGVRNYGACSLTLRTDYIKHRTTVFEENSAVFVKPIRVEKLQKSLVGYRASWADRGKLSAAKIGSRAQLTPQTTSDELPGIFLKQGTTSADDDFIEAHIWGPLTVRTVEHVEIRPRPTDRRLAPADVAHLKDALKKFGVTLELIP